MKSIILENDKGNAVLLREDGTFALKRETGGGIGTEITGVLNDKKRKKRLSRLIAAAAIALLFLGAGAYAYATPYYYLSLDVNPSIQAEANMFGKIIKMEAVNDDGEAIVLGQNYKYQNAEEVMTQLVDNIGQGGYLDDGENVILIASASKDEKKATIMAGKIEKQVAKLLKQKGYKNEIITDHYGYDMVQQAKAYGMTPGKYNLVTHVLGQTIGSQADADLYMNMSVHDLMKALKEKKNPNAGKKNNGKGN